MANSRMLFKDFGWNGFGAFESHTSIVICYNYKVPQTESTAFILWIILVQGAKNERELECTGANSISCEVRIVAVDKASDRFMFVVKCFTTEFVSVSICS